MFVKDSFFFGLQLEADVGPSAGSSPGLAFEKNRFEKNRFLFLVFIGFFQMNFEKNQLLLVFFKNFKNCLKK